MAGHGELAGEGKEGEGEEGGGGGAQVWGAMGRGRLQEGAAGGRHGEGLQGAVSCSCCFSLLHVFCFYVSVRWRKQQEGEEKKDKRKERMKEKKEKRGKFVNREISRKIKR
jgi:hypothetical protein